MTVEGKYVVTIELTSLNALKDFIRTVKKTGVSISISGVKTGFSSMFEKYNIAFDIEVENIFMSEIIIFASSINDLERAKAVLSCETTESLEKSAACTLLESVANFTGSTTRSK